MKITRAKIGSLEVEELACKIIGLDYDEIDADTDIINNKLYEELNLDLDDFTELIRRLLPLIDVGSSPLTQKRYKGFSDVEKQMWLVKTEVQ